MIEERRTIRRRRDEVKTMKTLKTLKDKREGLPEEEERDGSRPDVENKVKAKQSKAKANVAPMLGPSSVVGRCGWIVWCGGVTL